MKKKQGQEQHRAQVNYVDWVASTGTMWAVLCQGQPVHVRKEHKLKPENKYLNTVFSQRGSAENLATRLNLMFHTQDFSVQEVTPKTPH